MQQINCKTDLPSCKQTIRVTVVTSNVHSINNINLAKLIRMALGNLDTFMHTHLAKIIMLVTETAVQLQRLLLIFDNQFHPTLR